MRKSILTVLCTILVLCFSGCVVVSLSDTNMLSGKGESISGKGDEEKYEINVGEFNRIKVECNCEIQYYAVSSNIVTLEVQSNLREYFVVETQDGELIVRTTKNISKSSTPVLTVSTPALNSLTISGECTFNAIDKVRADTFNLTISGAGEGKAELEVNNLKANISGACSFELSGKADNAEIALAGAGEFKAFSLQVREATVGLSGAGTIKINCSEKLSINANGAGSIEYKGSPSVSLNKNGLVSVKKVD